MSFRLPRKSNPTLVTIFTGANDVVGGRSIDSFQSGLDKLISSLRENESTFIVIGDLPDLVKLPRFQDNPDTDVTEERVQAFNAAIHAGADKYSVPVAPLSTEPVEMNS